MALSIAQLLAPPTKEETRVTLTENLDALGFNASSWQSGTVQRDMLEMNGAVWADVSQTAKVLTQCGFNDLATGGLLTAFSKSRYDNDRIAAVNTRGPLTLTAATGAGPYTINIGDLIAESSTGRTFRNVTAGTIPLSGSPSPAIEFEAEIAGTGGNVANNTITSLQTPLAGVTVSNPSPGGGAPWYTTAGASLESDANLRTRNRTKWAQLAVEKPSDGYLGIVLAVSGVTRAMVDDGNPGGEGTIHIWIANETGAVGGADVIAAQAAVDLKRAPSAIATVRASAEQLLTITGTIYVETAKNTATKQAEIETAITAFVNSLPISGTILPPSATGVVSFSELVDAITSIDGVVSVTLSAPLADVAVTPWSVATAPGSYSFTYISA